MFPTTMFPPYDGVWKKQDLQMALVLKDYGFTHLFRVCPDKLLAAVDNGVLGYEVPWICFMFLEPGRIVTIDEIIADARRLANDTAGTDQ